MTEKHHIEGQSLAILVEVLYVTNLLLLPFLSFAVLLWLYISKSKTAPSLARAHLSQAISASIWIAILFLISGGCLFIMHLAGVEDATLWVVAVIAFTLIHACMVLLGIIGLARAMSGKSWRYPLVGRPLPERFEQ